MAEKCNQKRYDVSFGTSFGTESLEDSYGGTTYLVPVI